MSQEMDTRVAIDNIGMLRNPQDVMQTADLPLGLSSDPGFQLAESIEDQLCQGQTINAHLCRSA